MKTVKFVIVGLLVIGSAAAQADVRCKLTVNESSSIAELAPSTSSTLLKAKVGQFSLDAFVDEKVFGSAEQPSIQLYVSSPIGDGNSKSIINANGAMSPSRVNTNSGEKSGYVFSAYAGDWKVSAFCARYETLSDNAKASFDHVNP